MLHSLPFGKGCQIDEEVALTQTAEKWPLQAARNNFSQLIKATATGPQVVSVHGNPAAVLLSPRDYARLKSVPHGRLSLELLCPGLLSDADESLFEREDDTAALATRRHSASQTYPP